MARKKYNQDEEDDNTDWGTGQFSSHLLDKLDDEVEDFSDEQEISLDDDEKIIDFGDDELIGTTNDDDDDHQPKKRKNVRSKLIGKHSLKYDTIFKGKKDPVTEEYQSEHIIKNAGGSLDIDDSDLHGEESKNNIDSYRDSILKEQIYKILKDNTDIKFHAHMRKPAKTDFNAYFALLIKELAAFGYTNSEIFIELSGYFSPNIWNMFILLDKKFGKIIIKELQDKFGLTDIDKMDFIS